MTFSSPNLNMPYIAPDQAQKHVTHNDAVRMLDALVQITVQQFIATLPASPAEGACYIVEAIASDPLFSQNGQILNFTDGSWASYLPQNGWVAWQVDVGRLIVFDGLAWVSIEDTIESLNDLDYLGINTAADATNRLSIKSPATLFDNTGQGHQCKINKASEIDTASLLFQTGYSGRAEMGLTGDDDFQIKVSADGASWNNALRIDSYTGTVIMEKVDLSSTFPTGSYLVTIANGELVIDSRKQVEIILVATEASAATDDLHTITGGITGQIIIFHSPTSSKDPTFKDATGNLKLAGDFTLTRSDDILVLVCIGSIWLEISRSDNRV